MYSNTDGSSALAPGKDFLENFKGYNFKPEIVSNQSADLEKISLTLENKLLKAEVTKLQSIAYSLQNEEYLSKSIQQGVGVRMKRKQILSHLIPNALSWVATGVFAALFFSGAAIAPVVAGAGLLGGLITSVGLTIDSALR